MAATVETLPLGEGLVLTLSNEPPPPSLFKIVMVTEGRGRWTRGGRERALEPSSAWWAGRSTPDQAWNHDGGTRWLCLTGETCPVPAFDAAFERLTDLEEPRCCASVVADARELVSIVTDCPYPCELKNLLVRGKSLMLISKTLHALEQAEAAPESPSYEVRFFQSDLERVRQAREALLSRMENPPGLAELAREVGLNELKLKAGFRKLWGTTVYGLLRKERLAAAHRFLTAGQGNVGEAAYRVGYINTSHFAQAFQKEYGVSPGTLARSHA